MKKLSLLACVAALAVSTVPSAVSATPVIEFNGTSGTFGNTNIGSGLFDNSFTFDVGGSGVVGSTISSIAVNILTDISFSSVSLNGVEFTNFSSGPVEFRSLMELPVSGGAQTLRVRGHSGGNGAYSGTIAFTSQEVPEPAGWTTMLVALGILGGALKVSRRRAVAR